MGELLINFRLKITVLEKHQLSDKSQGLITITIKSEMAKMTLESQIFSKI